MRLELNFGSSFEAFQQLSGIGFVLADLGFGRSFAHDMEDMFILVKGDLFSLLKFRHSRVCVSWKVLAIPEKCQASVLTCCLCEVAALFSLKFVY